MTEPTTQTLIDKLRGIVQKLRTTSMPISDIAPSIHKAADALEAQALALDVQAGSIEAVQAANQRLAAERDTLKAELAAIRAVPVADVNAGLVEDAARYQWLRDNFTRLIVSTTPVCLGENDDGTLILRTYVQHVYVNENFRFSVSESVDQAVDAARTQQAQKGGE
jgi:hypothetical protein